MGKVKEFLYEQIAEREDQELVINIDYFEQMANVYTNKSSIMNRLHKRLLDKPNVTMKKIFDADKKVVALQFKFPLENLPYIMSASLLKAK